LTKKDDSKEDKLRKIVRKETEGKIGLRRMKIRSDERKKGK
jgi:hypothetical protein